MIEKITKYKKYILGVTGVLLALTMLVGIKYLMKPKYEEIPEVKLINIKDNKSFAIMVQNGDTYEEYTSEDDAWPGADYVFKEAKCTDNNGALVENAITFAEGKATLTTNKTIYCTLYFDEMPKTTIEILRDNDINSNISSEPNQGGMYRYQGTNDVPNWICFGTTNKEECIDETDSDGNSIPDGIDKYMYRIIGITEEGQMYLVKETFLKEGSVTGFSWDDVTKISGSDGDTCPDGKCPEWNEADLFQRINGTANGTKAGEGNNNDSIDDNTDIFVDSNEYEYLKSGDSNGGETPSEWYNLIADHEWMYGDTFTNSLYNGKNMYDIETGQTETGHYAQNPEGSTTVERQPYTWSEKVKAKISLMYIHDVVYAYYDGSQENTRGNPGSYTNVANSWIHFQKDGYNASPSEEWLSTRWGVGGTYTTYVDARSVGYTGGINSGDELTRGYGARPVFYLSLTAKIASGDGTKSDPFILEI